MGTPIPPPVAIDPVAAGSPCPICWGTGKPFGAAGTPEEIVVNFSGINKGPNWVAGDGEPLNGEYTLPQISGYPCGFRLLNFVVGVEVVFLPTHTSIFMDRLSYPNHFDGDSRGPCDLLVYNDEDDHFTGGSALITIPGVV